MRPAKQRVKRDGQKLGRILDLTAKMRRRAGYNPMEWDYRLSPKFRMSRHELTAIHFDDLPDHETGKGFRG